MSSSPSCHVISHPALSPDHPPTQCPPNIHAITRIDMFVDGQVDREKLPHARESSFRLDNTHTRTHARVASPFGRRNYSRKLLHAHPGRCQPFWSCTLCRQIPTCKPTYVAMSETCSVRKWVASSIRSSSCRSGREASGHAYIDWPRLHRASSSTPLNASANGDINFTG